MNKRKKNINYCTQQRDRKEAKYAQRNTRKLEPSKVCFNFAFLKSRCAYAASSPSMSSSPTAQHSLAAWRVSYTSYT